MTDAPHARPSTQAAPPVRTEVRLAIERALAVAIAAGDLPSPDGATPTVEVERPANQEHGDIATNVAMKLARPLRRAPLEIAGAVAAALRGSADPLLASIDVAPPGFLNMRLADAVLERTVEAILADPAGWGRVQPVRARRVNVEFVSANPTGPLTIGNARGAFVGDLLCRVLEAGGQDVTREYYFNDSGAQIDKLGASVLALRRAEAVPEDGYHGDYVVTLAAELPDDVWMAASSAAAASAAAASAAGASPSLESDGHAIAGRWAAGRVREGIEASLARLGVRFDVWTTEASLHEHGWVQRAADKLRAAGHLYEHDGALWFRSTTFGDDKDRVVIRANGAPTYFAADIGYVEEKLSRGFDHLIYIWGADHHGTVARVRNAATAMGYDADVVEMRLYSWVRFIRDGVEVGMSKRAGTFITLDELLAEVGVDAARWFFASRAPTSAIDFDIELAKRQSNENPVYYVQYAHARIASILRKATTVGLTPAGTVRGALGGAPEAALARAVIRLPEVVEDAASAEETNGITAYATELATTFHAFYRDAKVVDPDAPDRSRARLALAEATRITLANALGLLGISAPDSM